MQIRRSIYGFLCVSLFFGSTLSGYAQADSTNRVGGLTIGIDISRFFVQLWNPVKGNFEFSLGTELGQNFSIIAEAGFLTTNFEEETYHYESGGSYYRLGFHYNLLKRKPNDDNTLFVGILYGLSLFEHKADRIHIDDGYWGSGSGSLPITKLTGNWMEVKGGLRVEIFRNWYLGWSVRLRIYLFGKDDPIMTPYIIPGFGKGGKKMAIGMSYSVFFRIPYGKRK